jgi:hypothetical protein
MEAVVKSIASHGESNSGGIALLLPTQGASLKKSLSHLSVAPSGHLCSSRRSHCATDRNEGSFMEPVLCSPTASWSRNRTRHPHQEQSTRRGKSPSRGPSVSAISTHVGLLIVLLAILLLRPRCVKPETAAYGSQRMCPSCGLITSRLKACCLECGQSLTVSVTPILDK